MSSIYYRVDVTYSAELRNQRLDADIAELVGRPINGSGCGSGQRQLEFYFNTRAEAEKAVTRVRRAKWQVSFQRFDGA